MPTAQAPFGLVQPLSVVRVGSWADSPIRLGMPVHFMVPIDDGREFLISVDGDENCTQSNPHPRMLVILGGRVVAASSMGSGQLIFVDRHTDGNYYGTGYPVPAAEPFPSIEDLLCAACATLHRPCNYSHPTYDVTSPILAKRRSDWGIEFYIRVDREGSFHTYPDVGGPFQSTEEAENAIHRYLHGRRHPSV